MLQEFHGLELGAILHNSSTADPLRLHTMATMELLKPIHFGQKMSA